MSSSEEIEFDEKQSYLLYVADLLKNQNKNGTNIINGPILNPSIKSLYWLFILLYSILAILGILLNIAIIIYTMYYKLYKDITHAFIVNLALCHFIQCSIVLPITLTVMLIQNWIFGQFLCFFLPMLQDIPLHVAIMSHVLIAWDRMRWLGDPIKGRLPTFVCCCATWLAGMVIALPYPIYTIYVDLGEYLPTLRGVGICIYNLMDDIHEYMRGLFVMMYCGPSILLAYLYIRTSQELRPPDGPFAVMMFEHRAELRNRQRNSSTSSPPGSDNHNRAIRTNSARSYDLYSAEMDVTREKRTQRTLGSMAATQVLCICPLMILRLARLVVGETYENAKHYDFTYLMFVWIAFLPTIIFPCIYGSQILATTEKDRLRSYFRLASSSARSKKPSHDDSIEQENITSTTIVETSSINTTNTNNNNNYNKNHIPVKAITTTLNTGSSTAPITTTKIPSQLRDYDVNCTKPILKTTKSINNKNKCEINETQLQNDKYPRSAEPLKSSLKSSSFKDGPKASTNRSLSIRNSNLDYGSASARNSIQSNTSLIPSPRNRIMSGDNVSNCESNITSSTYCNTGSSAGNLNSRKPCLIIDPLRSHRNSGSDNKGDFDKKWLNSLPFNSAASTNLQDSFRSKDLSFSDTSSIAGSSILAFNDTASNFDRDLEIIDLLERERSMDIQDMIEYEKRSGMTRTRSRRLPNIERIQNKSKVLDPFLYDGSQSSRYIGNYDNTYYPDRRSSHRSSQNSSIHSKRDSLKSIKDESAVALASAALVSSTNGLTPTRLLDGDPTIFGLETDNEIGSSIFPASGSDKISVIENRIKEQQQRSQRNSYSSSGRSSIKSRDFIASGHLANLNAPPNQHISIDNLGFRENLSANL